MNQEEQQKSFSDDLSNLINRSIDEFDLTYCSIVGILETHKFELLHNLYTEEDDEDDLDI